MMADKKPDYTVERRRLSLTLREHQQTINKGRRRIEEIDEQKDVNTLRAEMSNAELDSEIKLIQNNELALQRTIADIQKKLELMIVAEDGSGEER